MKGESMIRPATVLGLCTVGAGDGTIPFDAQTLVFSAPMSGSTSD